MAEFAEAGIRLLAEARRRFCRSTWKRARVVSPLSAPGGRTEPGSTAAHKGGASDLVQETFLEAQRDFAGFHGNSEQELLAWLSRVLLNNLGNFSRRYVDTNKRDVRREISLQAGDSSTAAERGPADSLPSPSGAAMQQEQAEALGRALERLPDHYRRVVMMRFQENRSFEEIGLAMQCSADAARKLWSRAMERLRLECENLS